MVNFLMKLIFYYILMVKKENNLLFEELHNQMVKYS